MSMTMKEEFTAVNMATAASNGFRDGQRAAQPAPAGEREALWQLIHDTLRNYRMSTLVDEDGDGYPLIDALTAGSLPVSGGMEECIYLADAIWNAIEAAWQRTQAAVVPDGWRAHSVRFARGVKCPQSIETLQAAWDRDQELIEEQRAEISRLSQKLNQARQGMRAGFDLDAWLEFATDKQALIDEIDVLREQIAAAPAQPAAQDQGEVQRLREALECVKQAGFDCGNDGWGVIHMTNDDWQIVLASIAAGTGQEQPQ